MANCSDYISADDLKTGKQAVQHIEHVAKSKDANGAHALTVTDTIRGEQVTNLTLDGMETQFQDAQTQRESDFVASQDDKEARFQQFLLNSGYQFLGDYENGPYTITARNQIIRYQNEFWRLNASTNPPYTTTGINSTSWAVDVTHMVSVGDANLRQELASNNADFGINMLGLLLKGNLFDLIGSWVSPEAYNVVTNSEPDAHSNSLHMFEMFEVLRSRGGGTVVFSSGKVYYLDYVQFIPSNVKIIGNNAKIVFLNPLSSYGRGGFVIGSSREFNYTTAKSKYEAGTYPSSIVNSSFTDPAQKQYLRDNQSFVQSENVSISNLRIEAKFDLETSWGGYAINCVNSQNITLNDLYFKGWTEAINAGSDVPPNTPSCHNVIINNITVDAADLVRTYYAGFFFANSTSCRINTAILNTPLTEATLNGSFGALNFTENCVIENINVPDLGRTMSSEGVLVNNSKGARVRNVTIGNAKSAASTFYVDATMNDPTMPNIFDSVTGINCDQALGLTGKYAEFSNIQSINCTQEVLFRNSNCTGNILKFDPISFDVSASSTQILYFYLINNTVKNWVRKYTWLRPLDILKSPFTSLTSWNSNTQVKMATGSTVTFMYKISSEIHAVAGFSLYGNFSAGAQAAGVANPANNTTFTAEIITMSATNGNSSNPIILLDASRNAVTSGDGDFVLSANYQTNAPGFLAMKGVSGSVDNTMYLRITCINGVANNTLKEVGFRIYGV